MMNQLRHRDTFLRRGGMVPPHLGDQGQQRWSCRPGEGRSGVSKAETPRDRQPQVKPVGQDKGPAQRRGWPSMAMAPANRMSLPGSQGSRSPEQASQAGAASPRGRLSSLHFTSGGAAAPPALPDPAHMYSRRAGMPTYPFTCRFNGNFPWVRFQRNSREPSPRGRGSHASPALLLSLGITGHLVPHKRR